MGARPTPTLDWDVELGKVHQPGAEPSGRFIWIHGNDGAATSQFIRALRYRMESDSPSYSTVQISPLNSNTHYLYDIVQQLDISFKLDLVANPSGSLTLASGITAGGDVRIENVRVDGFDPFRSAFGSPHLAIAKLVDGVSRRMDEGLRPVLIFHDFQEATPEIRRRLRDELWDGGLGPLTDKGLIAIDFVGPPNTAVDDSWPPPADEIINLPESLAGPARLSAEQRLADLATEQFGYDPGEARVFASTLLASSTTVADLYARLFRTLVSLEADG